MALTSLNALMDAVGIQLKTIPGLRVYDYAADNIAVPAAVVGMPETVEYDQTFARGSDRVVIPVHLLVAKVSDRASRDALSTYLAGSGASSVKAALDGNLAGTVHDCRVASASPTIIPVAGVDHLAATLTLEVFV